jgi:hypothetical protein
MTERVQHRISRSPDHDLAEHLRDLATRVERLAPNRHDPETFHINKWQVAAELRRLARALPNKADPLCG